MIVAENMSEGTHTLILVVCGVIFGVFVLVGMVAWFMGPAATPNGSFRLHHASENLGNFSKAGMLLTALVFAIVLFLPSGPPQEGDPCNGNAPAGFECK